MKITNSRLEEIVREEIESALSKRIDESWLDRMLGRGGESGADYRRRKRGQDIEDAPSGALDKDVPDSAHQIHIVALLGGKYVGGEKVEGPAMGYKMAEWDDIDKDPQINRSVAGLKNKHPEAEIEVWQETAPGADRFQTGGEKAGDPKNIPGSTELGHLLYST